MSPVLVPPRRRQSFHTAIRQFLFWLLHDPFEEEMSTFGRRWITFCQDPELVHRKVQTLTKLFLVLAIIIFHSFLANDYRHHKKR
ncbi:unnamed protein product [Nesidiocoris tenuis]|uniref:Uncharacterized protein n=1 Tax=Nesidiocoris tenuis TaxID=355587 RepID=A0A6H5GLY5_9HEMI|nr:unnamed protein product [Nesidiocoris tenuis]